MKQEEQDLVDRKAFGAFSLTLLKLIAFNIKVEYTTVSLMEALYNTYEWTPTMKKVHFIKKLFNLKMFERENFKKQLKKFNEITDQLNFVEIKFDDENSSLVDSCLITRDFEGQNYFNQLFVWEIKMEVFISH